MKEFGGEGECEQGWVGGRGGQHIPLMPLLRQFEPDVEVQILQNSVRAGWAWTRTTRQLAREPALHSKTSAQKKAKYRDTNVELTQNIGNNTL